MVSVFMWSVVYFDQRMGAAHSKCWEICIFNIFCGKKNLFFSGNNTLDQHFGANKFSPS